VRPEHAPPGPVTVPARMAEVGWFLLISDKRKVTQVLQKAHNSLSSKELFCFLSTWFRHI
jgi:hypothetical protein